MTDQAVVGDREDPSVVSEEETAGDSEKAAQPAAQRNSAKKETPKGPLEQCFTLCDCGGYRQAEGRKGWSPVRKGIASVVESANFDMIMGLVIIFNVYIMVVEADDGARCPASSDVTSCTQDWVKYTNYGLLITYGVELLVRAYVYQIYFFHHTWNMLDFIIVIIGVFDVVFSNALEGVAVARMLRLGRLARLVKLLKSFPTLHSMIKGFYGTMSTIFWGFILIMVLLLISSIVSVELLHPQNMDILVGGDPEEWCYKAWSSVGHSIIYYFQTLVTGDSWGACAIPLIRVYPWTSLVFGISYITVQLGFTNLVLAVIVDAAAKARESDTAEKIREKKHAEKEATARLKAITLRMDKDKSGTISWEEMEDSYKTDADVQDLLALLDIDREDLKSMFRLMDSERKGNVSYDKFVDAISKAEEQDARVQLMMLKLHVSDITYKLERLLGPIENDVAGAGAAPKEATNNSVEQDSNKKVENFKSPSEEIAQLEDKLGVLRTDLLVRLETLTHDAADQVSLLTSQTKTLSASVAAAQQNTHRSVSSKFSDSKTATPAKSSLPETNSAVAAAATPRDGKDKDSSGGKMPLKPRETSAPKPTALGRSRGTGSGQGPGGSAANV